jgi:hypothetical protein
MVYVDLLLSQCLLHCRLYASWFMDCYLGEMIAYSYHEETSRHLVSCYASVGSDASVMLVLCSPNDIPKLLANISMAWSKRTW